MTGQKLLRPRLFRESRYSLVPKKGQRDWLFSRGPGFLITTQLSHSYPSLSNGQWTVSIACPVDFKLAPYLCSMSFHSWFQKHKDQLWTHLGRACFGLAIYGPEPAQNTKDMANFSELICYEHNFLPNAVMNLIIWPVIYNFPNLSIDIMADHILGHKWSCPNGHYWKIRKM